MPLKYDASRPFEFWIEQRNLFCFRSFSFGQFLENYFVKMVRIKMRISANKDHYKIHHRRLMVDLLIVKVNMNCCHVAMEIDLDWIVCATFLFTFEDELSKVLLSAKHHSMQCVNERSAIAVNVDCNQNIARDAAIPWSIWRSTIRANLLIFCTTKLALITSIKAATSIFRFGRMTFIFWSRRSYAVFSPVFVRTK